MLSFKHYTNRIVDPELGSKELIVVDRNMVWESTHGKKTKIVDMDDTYLANLLDYLLKRNTYKISVENLEKLLDVKDNEFIDFDIKLMLVIKELQKERGLKQEFMDRAQIPYKNPRGKWEIWDFDNSRPVELQESEE